MSEDEKRTHEKALQLLSKAEASVDEQLAQVSAEIVAANEQRVSTITTVEALETSALLEGGDGSGETKLDAEQESGEFTAFACLMNTYVRLN